jgi:hypothetical protein
VSDTVATIDGGYDVAVYFDEMAWHAALPAWAYRVRIHGGPTLFARAETSDDAHDRAWGLLEHFQEPA